MLVWLPPPTPPPPPVHAHAVKACTLNLYHSFPLLSVLSVTNMPTVMLLNLACGKIGVVRGNVGLHTPTQPYQHTKSHPGICMCMPPMVCPRGCE